VAARRGCGATIHSSSLVFSGRQLGSATLRLVLSFASPAGDCSPGHEAVLAHAGGSGPLCSCVWRRVHGVLATFVVRSVGFCRVLWERGCPIAPSSYYGSKARPARDRVIRDAELLVQIRRVHAGNYGVYGVDGNDYSCTRPRLGGGC
jgi:hypothetical protein